MKRAMAVATVLVFFGSLALAAGNREVSVRTAPPVVVKTVPQSGDTEIDPATTEIQVTYSKKMADKSWSWSQLSDETTPEMTGKPRYLEDRKTCVLPVKLEPGRTYAFLLNSEKFHNFRSEDGQTAMPYLLIFETRK